MTDTLTSEIRSSLAWRFQDALDLSTVGDISRLDYAQTLADGTAAGQADKIWHDQRTLTAASVEDLTLSALASTIFGSGLSIALAKVKGVLLINQAAVAGESLAIGGAAIREWQGPFAAGGDKLIVPADSCLLLVNKLAGWNVVAGVSDRLRIANSGTGSINYKIVILGTSA